VVKVKRKKKEAYKITMLSACVPLSGFEPVH
jgi:hypothetical protein